SICAGEASKEVRVAIFPSIQYSLSTMSEGDDASGEGMMKCFVTVLLQTPESFFTRTVSVCNPADSLERSICVGEASRGVRVATLPSIQYSRSAILS
ncbi:MAG: hypothetical protein J6Y22_09260, partial [Paludibacteraceae bacterium]|nr:hypothetical protein [Paludibacteraceae bacterium]